MKKGKTMTAHLESRIVSIWTFIGTLLLLGFSSYMMGGWSVTLGPVIKDLSLKNFALTIGNDPLAICFATTALASVCSLAALLAVGQAVRKKPLTALLLEQRQNFNFFHFFILTAIEEVVARWLFVGILPQHLGAFYACMVVGNLGWLFFRDRFFFNMHSSPLMLLPQFIAGLFYTYIFLHYGILASYLVHLGTKSMLLTFHKVEDDNCGGDKDFWMGIWSLTYMCLGCGYLVFYHNHTPWVVGNWISQDSFQVEGWDFSDYLALSFVLIYMMKAVGLFFCFDQGCVQKNGKAYPMPVPYEVFIGCSTLTCMVFIGSLLLMIFVPSLQIRALIMAMAVCYFAQPSSGSGRVRNFWSVLVVVLVTLCVVDSIAWYWVPAYLGLHGLLYFPFIVMERKPNVQPNP